MHDDQRGDRSGETDIQPAEACHVIRFSRDDRSRLHEHHVIELQAFGKRCRNQDRLAKLRSTRASTGHLGAGIEDFRILAQ